ncbi:MAG: hypothetical protein K8S97_13810 [Anaerolineae bacterium]|nr:hypothetical protein [Anaerolineae bacterium]
MKKLVTIVCILGALVMVLAGTVNAQGGTETRVLMWEFTPDNNGRLEVLTAGGGDETLIDLPDAATGNRIDWIKRCGQDSWSAGGQGVAIFSGANTGEVAIYPLAAGGAPVSLGTDVRRQACAGPATFQFSPDGSRVGYINYAFDFDDDPAGGLQEYPDGDLLFFDANTGSQLASFDHVNSFAFHDDGAFMLRVYPNGEGYGAEADLDFWDGSGRRNLVTLMPIYPPDLEDVDCGIKDSSIVRLGDTVYVLLGQRCHQTSKNMWRLISVPVAGGAATEIVSGEPPFNAGFHHASYTVNLIPTTDGAGLLATVPSGLTQNTSQLMWLTPTGDVTVLFEGEGRHVMMDRLGEKLSEGRLFLTSPDGSALAFSTTTANDQSLWMLDLSTPGGVPVVLQEQGTNERVFQHVWSANNRLFYIAGSVQSNSLYIASPGGSPQRLERGRFFRLAVSYDGNKLAVAEWYENPESLGDDLFKLRVFDTSGNAFDLKVGDNTHNQMIPLAIQ